MKKEYFFKPPKTKVVITDSYVSLTRGEHDYMIHKMLRGETKVFYKQIVKIKFHKAGIMSKGYLQFCTPRTSMLGYLRTVDQPENAIIFKSKQNAEALEIKELVESYIQNNASLSV